MAVLPVCGYVLLGKKCLALRIGSRLGPKGGGFAEDMLILLLEVAGRGPC